MHTVRYVVARTKHAAAPVSRGDAIISADCERLIGLFEITHNRTQLELATDACVDDKNVMQTERGPQTRPPELSA